MFLALALPDALRLSGSLTTCCTTAVLAGFYMLQILLAPSTPACRTAFTGVARFAAGDLMAAAPGGIVNDENLYKHELGRPCRHLIGLPHSGFVSRKDNKYDAYGDLSMPMGISGEGCLYSGPEMIRLGWATPAAAAVGSAVVPWSSVQAGTTFKFTLTALADNPSGSAATAVVMLPLPDASSTAWPSNFGYSLYLTYRVAKKMDSGLPQEFHMATSLHTHHTYPDGSGHDYELVA